MSCSHYQLYPLPLVQGVVQTVVIIQSCSCKTLTTLLFTVYLTPRMQVMHIIVLYVAPYPPLVQVTKSTEKCCPCVTVNTTPTCELSLQDYVQKYPAQNKPEVLL